MGISFLFIIAFHFPLPFIKLQVFLANARFFLLREMLMPKKIKLGYSDVIKLGLFSGEM